MARPEPTATRDRILDAAEQLFATRGFHGASVRDIFKRAGLGAGLMGYYFASKEDLFRETVERRIPQVRETFEHHFPVTDAQAIVPVRELLEFYLEFFLIDLPDAKSGLHTYWDLLSKCAVSYELQIVSSSLGKLDFIAERMMEALQASLPDTPESQLRDTLAFAEAAVTTLNASAGLFEHRQGKAGSLADYVSSMAGTLATGLQGAST
ncbi:TetR/AcrR family transcriptional regulator [Novosphingobium sp. YJ-S2-02]|uniref:TetR/AcrR family transcriptional regulator n=1 Tax=Novosphingobium aureum TaxID=2792964 RepID=A0A931MJL6_9SPHN|nr:TetR/AcrR family transcriptional regulator [Novosphingobium aureum]MBH0111848.1 TetR/AcrR family transcriptional regulator [Novosphingobium aureum]